MALGVVGSSPTAHPFDQETLKIFLQDNKPCSLFSRCRKRNLTVEKNIFVQKIFELKKFLLESQGKSDFLNQFLGDSVFVAVSGKGEFRI